LQASSSGGSGPPISSLVDRSYLQCTSIMLLPPSLPCPPRPASPPLGSRVQDTFTVVLNFL
jgi:hypothetical protein